MMFDVTWYWRTGTPAEVTCVYCQVTWRRWKVLSGVRGEVHPGLRQLVQQVEVDGPAHLGLAGAGGHGEVRRQHGDRQRGHRGGEDQGVGAQADTPGQGQLLDTLYRI